MSDIDPTPIEEHTNLNLIYTYTESILKTVSDGINIINTKLSTVIAFNGVLLNIATNLPTQSLSIDQFPCNTCLLLKVSVYCLSLISLWIATLGLSAQEGGEIVKPGELIDNWYYETDERCRLFIVKGLRQGVEQLVRLRTKKAKRLNFSIYLLATSATCFAIDSAIGSVWNNLP